jgi:hypothetical protein
MYEEDLTLNPEMLDKRWQILGHKREVALAEGNAIGGAIHQLKHTVECLDASRKARHSADLDHWRIVWVQRQLNPVTFGNRQDRSEEVAQRIPELLLGESPCGRQWCLRAHDPIVVLTGQGSST